MKNLIFILTILIITVSCNNSETKKTATCTSFHPECELVKNYQFVQPAEQPDSTFIDAYGNLIIKDKWYIRSMKTGILNRAEIDPEHNFSYNDFDNADKPGLWSKMRVNGEVRSCIHTVLCKTYPNGEVKSLKVKILLFGPQCVESSFTGLGYMYDIH